MNPPKCTCRCTCKLVRNSDMDNARSNHSCSLLNSESSQSVSVQSSELEEVNFTSEQQNMILKIEAYNREIIKEICRLQVECVKTNEAISLLKEHSNFVQSSCLSPRSLRIELPLNFAVQIKHLIYLAQVHLLLVQETSVHTVNLMKIQCLSVLIKYPAE
ncbi:unnamed protein product [Heterobilharzia americana]|nr:unnamed protein product [Heterobilharzia americana]